MWLAIASTCQHNSPEPGAEQVTPSVGEFATTLTSAPLLVVTVYLIVVLESVVQMGLLRGSLMVMVGLGHSVLGQQLPRLGMVSRIWG